MSLNEREHNGSKLGAKMACPVRAEIFLREGVGENGAKWVRVGALDTGLAFDKKTY